MSSNNVVFNNGQQLQVQTSLAKLFPFDKKLKQYAYTNSTYDPIDLPAGTVMGVIAATGYVVPMTSGATDGSQFPMGILAEDYTIDEGQSINMAVMVQGQVRQDMLILQGSDTLSTVVSSRRIFERIGSDSCGILIISATNCTAFDNTLS
jgi:hypothetical protein